MMRWITLFVFCWLSPAAVSLAELDPLIESIVAAYGGHEAVARLEAFRVEAQVTARMRGATGKVRRDFQAPDRLRVEIAYPNGTEVRVLDGERGWRGDDRQLKRVDGLPNVAMVYQALRSAVPWVFVHHRKILEDRGRREWQGNGYRLVGLPLGTSLDLTYWIDAASRRVTRVDGVLKARGAQTVFGTAYGDFRRVEGLLFPFTEDNFASGHHTGKTKVLSVAFSPGDLGPFDPTRLGQ
jgi:hypothetical protein